MRTFDNEWIHGPFEHRSSFFTKRMFGGLAVYLHGRQMLVLVEPTRTGRWTWHGVLVCTDHVHQPSLISEFPGLATHAVLKKWLYIDTHHEQFEATMERVAAAIARNDTRLGVEPRVRRPRAVSPGKGR